MKHFLIIMTLMVFGMGQSFAQSYTTKKTTSKKALKAFEKGVVEARAGRKMEALTLFEKAQACDEQFIDVYIQRGYLLYDMKQFAKAEQALEQVIAMAADYRSLIYYSVGMAEWKQSKYSEAVEHFKQFLESDSKNEKQRILAKRKLIESEFAKNAVKYPIDFDPIALSDAINTEGAEYFPSLTADGQLLFYTAVRKGQEDFYFSKKENGKWSAGKPLLNVNTNLNEGAQCISADGKTLVFTACNRKGGVGSCDLYFSEFKNGEWTKTQNMGRAINSSEWDSQPSLTSDGKTLYFASKRANGTGGADIMMSQRNTDGTWTKPVGISDKINTTEDEETPFIHPDGQTMYFKSNGLPGMGKYDLFVVRKDENGEWQTPVNMGYPLNTKRDEGTLIVSLDGATGFFDSNRNTDLSSRGNNIDIYTFEMPEAARPLPVTYVKAKVVDATSRKPLVADIDFLDVNKNSTFLSNQTADDGTFLVCLPIGKEYALDVSKEGYIFHSENFALEEARDRNKPFVLEIALARLPKDETVVVEYKPIILKNIFFETGSAELKAASFAELNRLKQMLVDNAGLRIQINGHTDNVGSTADNQLLSENRAKAVFDYLIESGILRARLSFKGFGESQPIDNNETEKGRRTNRRTEFVIRQ